MEALLTDTTARDPLRSLLRALGPLVLAVLGLVLSTPTASQTPQFEEFHTWTDIATSYNFSERFRYDGDYGLRGLLTDSNWTLLYLRPSVRYQVRPWLRLHGGAALFYNFFSGEDLPELRPWVGVRFLGPRPGGWGRPPLRRSHCHSMPPG